MKKGEMMGRSIRGGFGRMFTWGVAGVAIIILSFGGCASSPTKPTSPLETPEHYYTEGMQALESGNTPRAMRAFEQALDLREDYSPALAGRALALAIQSRDQTVAAYRSVDAKEVRSLLEKSRKSADSPEERYIYHVSALRTESTLQRDSWVKRAEQHYLRAREIEKIDTTKLPYYRNTDAALYFMAEAWYKAHDFQNSEALLTRVLGARGSGKWQGPSNALYRKVHRIVRASAGYTLGGVAKEIAVKEQVERADVAMLLVDELKLERLFAGRIPSYSTTSRKPEFIPVDILKHPFRKEIETLLKWDVRGMGATYDSTSRAWLFHPQSPVTRKELALIFEDVLVKITGDETIPTKMIGAQNSPFPDVKPEAAWFNAVSTVTSRGLMEPDLSGEFRPNHPSSGAEVLLGIYKLRNSMNIH